LLLLSCLAIYLGLFAFSSRWVIDHDAFSYSMVTKLWLKGEKLYGGAWEFKPPLAFVFYVIPTVLSRQLSLGLQVYLACWLMATAWTVKRGLRDYGADAGLIGALVVLILPFYRDEFLWCSTEHAANLPVIVVLLTALRLLDQRRPSARLALLHGFSLVLATQIRQNTALFGLVSLWTVMNAGPLLKEKVRTAAWMSLGAAVAIACIVAVVFTLCDPPGYWETVILAPRRYGSGWKAQARLLWQFRGDALLLFLAIATFTVTFRRRSITPLVMTVASLLCVLGPNRSYVHYWLHIVPATAVLGGLALQDVVCHLRETRSRHLLFGAMAGAVLFVAANGVLTLAGLRMQRTRTAELDRVVASLNRLGTVADTVYVVGDDDVYIVSCCRPRPSDKFFWSYFLMPGWSAVLPEPVKGVYERMRTAPPDLLAVTADWLGDPSPRTSASSAETDELRDMISYWLSTSSLRQVDEVGKWMIFVARTTIR
jgi:hypothetical protein